MLTSFVLALSLAAPGQHAPRAHRPDVHHHHRPRYQQTGGLYGYAGGGQWTSNYGYGYNTYSGPAQVNPYGVPAALTDFSQFSPDLSGFQVNFSQLLP